MLKQFINYHPNKNAVVLDFFAGSGSTGHAVMSLNSEDGGNRKFILCTNNENNICEEKTYPRLKNVINGFGNNKALEGSLRYYKTDFVDNKGTKDQIYYDLTEKCIPMLCIKEDTYDLIRKNEQYAIYSNRDKNKYTCVYYDTIGDKYDEFIESLKKIEEEKVLYIFSLGNEIEEPRLKEMKNYRIEAIPQRIYGLYKKLVKMSKDE